MKKSDLIASIQNKNPFLTEAQVHQIVDIVFNEITNGLKLNKRIEIRGFGAFSIRKRNVQQSFPDKINSPIVFKKKNTAYFRMGKEFFAKLNNE